MESKRPRASPRSFDEIEISVTPKGKVDLEVAKQFAGLGINRIVLFTRARDEAGVLEFIQASQRDLIGKV